MSKLKKLIDKILRGTSDANIEFEDLRRLLLRLDFQERVRGSHHIFSKVDVEEIINLQPSAGNKAKPYQVKQVRGVILKYRLIEEEQMDDEPTQHDDNE